MSPERKNSGDGRTVTKSRTKIETKEVEEELYVCRNCRQTFEEIVPVELPEGDRQLCSGCADSVLDYDGEPKSTVDYVREATAHWDAKDIAISVSSPIIALGAALSGIVLSVKIAGPLLNAIVTPTETALTAMFGPFGSVITSYLIGAVAMIYGLHALHMFVGGPR